MACHLGPAIQTIHTMKPLLLALATALMLSSCVFESPFEAAAKIPTDEKLLGIWEEKDSKETDRLTVLQHSANEYTIQYPGGDDAMFFRAYGVEIAGSNYVQVQLIGTRKGPAQPTDRKYHLVKVSLTGDTLSLQALDPDVLGTRAGDTATLRAALAKHLDDPKLFQKPGVFKRVK